MSRDFEDAVRDGKIPGFFIDPDNPATAYDSMGLDTPVGAKVRFTGYGGWKISQEYARKHLQVGERYTVANIEVGDWSSTVEFEEVPGHRFNTVMFEAPLGSVCEGFDDG